MIRRAFVENEGSCHKPSLKAVLASTTGGFEMRCRKAFYAFSLRALDWDEEAATPGSCGLICTERAWSCVVRPQGRLAGLTIDIRPPAHARVAQRSGDQSKLGAVPPRIRGSNPDAPRPHKSSIKNGGSDDGVKSNS